jgi:hypothetical protein
MTSVAFGGCKIARALERRTDYPWYGQKTHRSQTYPKRFNIGL